MDLRKIGLKPHVAKPVTAAESGAAISDSGTAAAGNGQVSSGVADAPGANGRTDTDGGARVVQASPPATGPNPVRVGGIRIGGLPNRAAQPVARVEAGNAEAANPTLLRPAADAVADSSADRDGGNSLDSAAPALELVAQRLEPVEVPVLTSGGPDGFKEKLKSFDSLIQQNAGIDQLTLDAARAHVAFIMTELKQFPEYDGFVMDSDVHNLMLFARASASYTKSQFVVASERAAKRSDKASKVNAQFDLSSLNLPAPNAPPRLAAAAMSGLDALASLNVDDIAAAMSKGKKK